VLALLDEHGLDEMALQLCEEGDLVEVGFSNGAASELLALCGNSGTIASSAIETVVPATAPSASPPAFLYDSEMEKNWPAFHPQLNQGQRDTVNAILTLEAGIYTAADETNAAFSTADAAKKNETPIAPKQEVVQPAFIVFGPPGTGKTLTVVEAVMQLLQRNKVQTDGKTRAGHDGGKNKDKPCAALQATPGSTSAALAEPADGKTPAETTATATPPSSSSSRRCSHARVLLCAPSEAAANVLCLRLAGLGLDSTVMHRLAWWQVGLASLPPQLLKFVAAGDDGVLTPNCPPTSTYEVIPRRPPTLPFYYSTTDLIDVIRCSVFLHFFCF
jgi:hypothetical protein